MFLCVLALRWPFLGLGCVLCDTSASDFSVYLVYTSLDHCFRLFGLNYSLRTDDRVLETSVHPG